MDAPAESRLSGGGYPEKFLYFSGFNLWRSGGSFYGGMQWAPRGLNEDGFTLKLLLAEAGATNIRGTGLLASLMPGWRIKRGNFEAKIFAGLDLQNHRLSPDDPGNSLRGKSRRIACRRRSVVGADLRHHGRGIDLGLHDRHHLRRAGRGGMARQGSILDRSGNRDLRR